MLKIKFELIKLYKFNTRTKQYEKFNPTTGTYQRP